MRAVILGFDGLERRYLDRFAATLPAITSLRERGVETALESTHPPCSSSAWPSLYTGTDPSHHGLFGPFDAGEDGYPHDASPASGVHVRRPALWDYLSSEGATSLVVNVPLTHPADPTNGVVVPGPPAVEGELGYPDGIRAELTEAIGQEYVTYPRESPGSGPTTALELLEHHREAATSLLESREWELAICHVQGIGEVATTGNEKRLRAAYEAADRFLEDVLEIVDEETSIICASTHKVERTTREIGLNDFLYECGYVESTVGSRRSPSPLEGDSEPTASNLTDDTTHLEAVRSVGRRVAARLGFGSDSHSRTHSRPYSRSRSRRGGRLGLESLLARVRSTTSPPTTGERVEWRTSLAYCPSGEHSGIRVNLAGREPNGRVPPSRYQAVCEDLVDQLTTLETPTGEPAFESVMRREECYDGPFLENAPDVLVRPVTGHTVSATLGDGTFRSLEHHRRTPDGFFVGAGPGFVDSDHECGRDAGDPDRLSITDVAPTTMGVLGRPIPSLMTGTVHESVVSEPASRADYIGVAAGTATADPTFDDADITSHHWGLDSRDW